MTGIELIDTSHHTLMKTFLLCYLMTCFLAAWAADAPPPGQPAAVPAPPPSSPALRSAAELEKLVAPIALYADPLIATLLPASVYPLEIVQAARFVANTNNLSQLDAQPWDDNVKAVARVPELIKKMNDDLPWTIALGEAFLAQDKDVMDTIQDLRAKAQKAGTLQTTQQQVVVVTNMVVQTTVEQRVVVVTNTVVQIQSSSPEVVYVPTYNPYTVYYPPPAYVYDPYAPLVTFAAGVAVGAIIANNCDWHSGGIYVGHHGAVVWGGGGYGGDVDIDIDIDNNFNRNVNVNNPRATTGAQANATGAGQKWQPDQNRVRTSGSPTAAATAGSREARGYGSAGRPTTPPSAATRPSPSTGISGARPSTGSAAARPSTGTATTRPSTGTAAARPSTGAASASRPSPTPSAASASRLSGGGSSSSAFGGVNSGAGARNYSSRGASSRSSGGGFSGGGRGGGGRGRR
jgi:hypothetical protein